MNFTRRLDGLLATATKWLVVGLIAVMIAITAAAVTLRYGFDRPITWSEEVAKYLMVWVAFLAGSQALRDGAHVSVDIFVALLPIKGARICALVSYILVCAFLLVLLIWGAKFVYGVRTQYNPMLWNMSMVVPYAAVPVGAFLMLLRVSFAYFLRSDYKPEAIQ